MRDYDNDRKNKREWMRRQRALATIGSVQCSSQVEGRPCKRTAVENGLCRQHAGIRWCRARGCDKQAVAQEGEWWFCREHRRLWAEHNAIVQRVLEFKPSA